MAAAVALAALPACLAPEPVAISDWPPYDFELVLQSYQLSGDVLQERQRVLVRADGLLVYREANSGVGGQEQQAPWLPVFDVVSAYRLRDESLRQLTRLLDDAGLFQFDGATAPPADWTELIRISWRAHAREGTLVLTGNDTTRASRILHVINAYLPDGYALATGQLVGEAEVAHLIGVPAPRYSRREALHFHWLRWCEEPQELRWMLDLFALAMAAGDRELAEEMILRVREHPAATRSDDPVLGRGSGIALDQVLERILAGS